MAGAVCTAASCTTLAAHGGDEGVQLFAGEPSLPAGRSVAAHVPGVCPAADRGQRDAQVAGSLRAREHELPVVAGKGACGGHIRALSVGVDVDRRPPCARRVRRAPALPGGRPVSCIGRKAQEVERRAALWTFGRLNPAPMPVGRAKSDGIIGSAPRSNVRNPARRCSSWTVGLIVRYPRKTYLKVAAVRDGHSGVRRATQRRTHDHKGMAPPLGERRGLPRRSPRRNNCT